jgi:Asp-tRNA(Asn)/Glu-tRNA(Gln) amidotransferase C subunit
MKHTILRKVGSALLITGLTFALPAYAEKQGGTGTMGMGEKGTTDAQQMSGMMHDMSGEMMKMSGMMDKGDMNPDAMKEMAKQTKQMGSMMENMSGMMGKGAMMDASQHKQMNQMRKDMPASPEMK